MDANETPPMKYTLSSFTVRQEHLKQARRALAQLVAQVREHEPATLYLVFREEEQAAFFCLMAFEDEAAERRHAQSRHVEHFAKRILPLCEGKPRFTDLGFFAGSKQHWMIDAGLTAGQMLSLAAAHPGRGPGARRRPARGRSASPSSMSR